MEIDHNMIRRLAFVRHMYNTAMFQSYAPAPLSCASLLTMHDAVELFLQMASEHLNVGSQQPSFMDYWDLISKKLGRELEQKESMRRLNKARVAIKHHGTFPSALDIEAFRGSVTNFFSDNTPIVFGLSITDVSLVEYVNPESSRNNLKEAEILLNSGDTLSALDKIAVAFAEMIRDYEVRKRDRFCSSPFFFGRNMCFVSSHFMGLAGKPLSSPEKKLADFIDGVKESIESMQEAMKMLALGLDYRKYAKFRRLTPFVRILMSGDNITMRRLDEESKPTVEEARFCIDFVLESALALAEFDYTVPTNRT